ncbi:hypothetical protein PMAYCL1PPCAC_31473, partial [Pristionchus mayeri]
FLSAIIVLIVCCINIFFVCFISYLTLSKPFEAQRVAISITICCWHLQATLSMLFLAYWQWSGQPDKILKLLHEANKGVGISHNRKHISS